MNRLDLTLRSTIHIQYANALGIFSIFSIFTKTHVIVTSKGVQRIWFFFLYCCRTQGYIQTPFFATLKSVLHDLDRRASPPTPPKTAEQKNHRFSSFAVTNQKQGFIK